MRPFTHISAILSTSLLALGAASALADAPNMQMTTELPDSITTPDSVDTSLGTLTYRDGVPTGATVETLYDYLDRSRAVDVMLNTMPTMSAYALREGQRAAGCADAAHQICIFDTLMDSTSLFLTGNTSTMYAIGFLDLGRDGPTVIELPPGMLGVLDDMAFEYMTDLGAAGPDKGKGGKYLVLPPGYDGDVPDGYFVVQVQYLRRVELHARLSRQQPAHRQGDLYRVEEHPRQPEGVSAVAGGHPAGNGIRERVRQGDEHGCCHRCQFLFRAERGDPARARRVPGR